MNPPTHGPPSGSSAARAELQLGQQRIAALEHQLALAEAERLASEEEVKALQARLEQMATLLADAQRSQAAAERWLEDHRNSLSWRITAPLRAAKQRGLQLRRRGGR